MSEGAAVRAIVDPGGLMAFWAERYLDTFVADGGAAVKWLCGKEGSGKTTLLAALRARGAERGFLTAHLDASSVLIGRIDELYRHLLDEASLDVIATLVAAEAGRRLGAADWTPDPDAPLRQALVAAGRPPEAVDADLQQACDFLYKEPNIASPVASALRWMAAPLLRGGAFYPEQAAVARAWLSGEKVRAAERRPVGATIAIARSTAREVWRSVLWAMRLCGGTGLLLTVDGLEALAGVGEGLRYTRLRRLDAYETLREMVDEAGRMPGLMVVCAGRPDAFTDDRTGMGCYPALAMRVRSEIVADRLNLFNDLQDLDALWMTDWPRHRAALIEAYGPGAHAPSDADLLVAASPVSPVARLVKSLTGDARGGMADG